MDLIEVSKNVYRHPWELSRKDMLIRVCDKFSLNGKVLDVGCGDGYFDECLVNRNKNVNELYGIDVFAEENIDNEKTHYYNSYSKIDGIKFDSILMMDVLEHIEDDEIFLKNILEYGKKIRWL